MRLGPLSVFQKTSCRTTFLLAAWHWRRSLTWSWTLTLNRHTAMWPKPWALVTRDYRPGFGAGLGQLLAFNAYRDNGGWQASLSAFWLSLDWRRQRPVFRDVRPS